MQAYKVCAPLSVLGGAYSAKCHTGFRAFPNRLLLVNCTDQAEHRLYLWTNHYPPKRYLVDSSDHSRNFHGRYYVRGHLLRVPMPTHSVRFYENTVALQVN